MKDQHDKNSKIIWNALTSKEVPSGRKPGNISQRNSFSRVYLLYRTLHQEWHKPEQTVEGITSTVENYKTAIVQALHAQPYHNLPAFPEYCYTGFKSKNAEKAEKNGTNPTDEHVYPSNRTLRIDLFAPKSPLSFREFVYHYVSKGGLFSKTTPTENRDVANYHRQYPKAIMTEHWSEIYKKCKIKKA